jgi:5'-nucleotidase
MGRETKILLGLLGLLAGVFMGVLSMKLFVPRPPAGAGPDIQTELADSEPHDLVEPPRLTMRASDFAAAPPLVPAAMPEDRENAALPPTPPVANDRYAAHDGRFERAEVGTMDDADQAPPPRRDPFVAAASFEQPDDAAATATSDRASPPPVRADEPHQPIPLDVQPPHEPRSMPLAGSHVAQPGDTWWSLAERAYGDGRLYRALYAWNRTRDPRIALAPGTPLQLPPLADLAATWPQLMPPPGAAASDRRPL